MVEVLFGQDLGSHEALGAWSGVASIPRPGPCGAGQPLCGSCGSVSVSRALSGSHHGEVEAPGTKHVTGPGIRRSIPHGLGSAPLGRRPWGPWGVCLAVTSGLPGTFHDSRKGVISMWQWIGKGRMPVSPQPWRKSQPEWGIVPTAVGAGIRPLSGHTWSWTLTFSNPVAPDEDSSSQRTLGNTPGRSGYMWVRRYWHEGRGL